MKKIHNITGSQLREMASLRINNTNNKQASELYFVQLDDEHAVDNTDCIFQIIDKDFATDIAKNPNALQYEGESGTIYNYAEDSADFAEDSDDLEIYAHCVQQAELLFEFMSTE
jgi:secreted PhoX family phosphatase